MHLKRIPLLCAWLLSGLTIGCGDMSSALGGCPTNYSFDWRTLNLGLEHQRPHSCPVLVGADPVRLEAGGVVDATNETSITRTVLAVQNRAGDVVGGRETAFRWNPENRWVAEVNASYQANTIRYTPDAARFQLYRGSTQGPSAIMTITYASQVMVNLLGPDAVVRGGSGTWHADVTSGTPPFQYYWYRDWNLVGYGSSYTADAGEGSLIDLRVDVFDAEGHAASATKQVSVHAATEPPPRMPVYE
jgi:hypothetical protein